MYLAKRKDKSDDDDDEEDEKPNKASAGDGRRSSCMYGSKCYR